MPEQQPLWTTPQAAELLEIPASTIRRWLSKRQDIILDRHVFKDESGRNLWTEDGLELLRFLKNGSPPASESFEEQSLAILEPVLEQSASELALAFWQQLPMRTLQRIQEMATNPTEEEREVVMRSVAEAINSNLPSYVRRLLPDASAEE